MNPDFQPTTASPVALQVITGQVIDKTDGLQLARATIRVVNQDNVFQGDGTTASAEGFFELNSPLLRGNLLEISHVGYGTQYWDPADMAYYTVIPLVRSYEELAAVVVTPKNNKRNALPWILAGAAALLLIKTKKR